MTLGWLQTASPRASQASDYLAPSHSLSTSRPHPLLQSVTSTRMGKAIVRACLGTSGTPASAPITAPARPPTTAGPAAVWSLALLKPGTASCCHLVRRVGNLETNELQCVFSSLTPVFLPAGPSPGFSTVQENCQLSWGGGWS